MRYINGLARRKDSEGLGVAALDGNLKAVFGLWDDDKYIDERTGHVSNLGSNELGNGAIF